MPTISPHYRLVVQKLEPILRVLPPNIVAITGPMLSGKTTLGRYLAWEFNCTLLEYDLFLVPPGQWQHDTESMNRIIAQRLGMNRPIIIEGVTILQLLTHMDRTPAFIVKLSRVKNYGHSGSSNLTDSLQRRFSEVKSIEVELEHE